MNLAPLSRSEIARTIWPFLFIAFPAALAIAPSVSVDSAVIASSSLGEAFPHFPPLYLIFVRLMAIGASVLNWLSGSQAPHFGIVDPAPFTAVAGMLTVLVQHFLTLVSAAYLANRLRPDRLGQLLIVAVLYLNPFTLQMIHGVETEALVIPAVYAATAEAFVILAGTPTRSHYMAYLWWTLLACLTRHPAILIGALVPIGIGLKTIISLVQTKWRQARHLISVLCLVSLGVAGVEAIKIGASSVLASYLGLENTSIPGRAFTYRIAREYAGLTSLPGIDKAAFDGVIERLKERAKTAELKSDIDIVANTHGAWTGAYSKIHESVRAACPDCSYVRSIAQTDRRLNRVMTHTILSRDPYLLSDVLLRTVNFLTSYLVAAQNMQIFGMEVPPNKQFDPLRGFIWKGRDIEFIISDYAVLTRVYLFTSASVIVSLALAFPARRHLCILGFSFLGTAALYSLLVSLVTIYIPRYGLFVDQLALIAIVIVVSGASSAARAELGARCARQRRGARHPHHGRGVIRRVMDERVVGPGGLEPPTKRL